jgi:hypothetical protein
MPGRVKVGRSMAVLGRIAATDLAALQAHPQVNPRVSRLETFLTALGMRLHIFDMIFCVGTLRSAHGNPHSP